MNSNNLQTINIELDSSVKHISKVAAMALSGSIENGLLFVNSNSNKIVIYSDHIDFGMSHNPELNGVYGMFFTNFYMEYGKVIYRFGSNIKCTFVTKTIEYKGIFAPTTPDNCEIYNLIYPRFA